MTHVAYRGALLCLLVTAVLVGCGGGAPADPPASIAVECQNLAGTPITVGDSVTCSISLRHVRSDEDRPDTPPRIFSQAEWAFVSNDDGALYHSPAKPITGWFGGGLVNIRPEEDDTRRVNTCRGPNNARNASPVEFEQCDSVCCETQVGGRPRYDLLSRSACDAGGDQRPLSVCLPDETAGCCKFPNEGPGARGPYIYAYEVTSRALCETKASSTWNNIAYCACCKFDSFLGLLMTPYSFERDFGDQLCDIHEGEIVATEDCMEGGFAACGFDDACSVGYCENAQGGARIAREDDCDGPIKTRHRNETLVCCEDYATHVASVVGMPVDLTKRRWKGTTAYTFTALSAGNVTVMMRQTLNPPIAFVEASRGSSRVTVRIHAVRPQTCRQDADCDDDENVCTRERCVDGLCEHQPLGEGAECYVSATCATGTCVNNACETPPDADGNACEDDGEPCADSQCVAGRCEEVTDLCACETDEDCLGDPRDDGDPCTGRYRCGADKQCALDPTSVITCDPSADTPCSQNRCHREDASCSQVPRNEGMACDDGEACTGSQGEPDVCRDGTCDPGAELCACATDDDCRAMDDDDVCNGKYVCQGRCVIDPETVVTCDASEDTACLKNQCDPDTAVCSMGPADGACDDGDPCTLGPDVCEDGNCKGENPVACPQDADLCTTEVCDPADRECKSVGAQVSCDDGDACTVDACVPATGACVNDDSARRAACDDGNPCTDDGCSPQSGECTHVDNTAYCEDGDACTLGDQCNAGRCVPGIPPQCNDGNECTDDDCDHALGCVHADNVGPCSDFDACTEGDLCVAGACQPGAPLVCPDDANVCTVDACIDHQTGACGYDASAALAGCDDADPCTADDCHPLTGACMHDTRVADAVCAAVTCGSTCDPAGGCRAAGPCEAPDGLVAVAGRGAVTLTWGPVATATGYTVYFGFEPGVTPANGAAWPDSTSPQSISGLAADLPVYFVVVARHGGGESGPSNEASAAPFEDDTVAPFLLGSVPTDDDLGVDPRAVVRLRFSEPLDPATLAAGITVESGGGPVVGAAVQTGREVTFTPARALALATGFTVTLNAALTDRAGNPVVPGAVRFTTRPAAPVNLRATTGNGAVTLTWAAVAGATGYAVHRRGSVAETHALVHGNDRPAFTDPTVPNDADALYVVMAFTDAGESGPSPEVVAHPSAAAPLAPQQVVARAGNGVVWLSWSSSGPADTYEVLRSDSVTGAFASVARGLDAVGYRDASRTNGTRYHYVVQAVRDGVRSAWSLEASATPQAGLLPSPSGLTTTVGSQWARLDWTPVAGAVGYEVYSRTDRQLLPAVAGGFVRNPGLVELADGVVHQLSVAAIDAQGRLGPPSGEVEVSPRDALAPLPTRLLRTYATAHGQIRLVWTRSPGATSYAIKRREGGGPLTLVTTAFGTDFEDRGLAPGRYTYVVEPLSGGGASGGDSNALSASATAGDPVPPGNLVAEPGDGCVTLTWDAVPGALQYYLWRADEAGGVFAELEPTLDGFDNRFTNCELTNNEDYAYVVRTWDASVGYSDDSETIVATPRAAAPDTPVGVGVQAANGQVRVFWSAESGSPSYDVFRRSEGETWRVLGQTSNLGFIDATVENGLHYDYAVRGRSGPGAGTVGATSRAVRASTSDAFDPAPTNLRALAGNGCVTLSWDVVPGAASYYAARAEAPGGPYTELAGTLNAFDNRFTDCGLTNDVDAYYVVRTWDGAYSSYSAEIVARPSSAAPPTPVAPGLQASRGQVRVELSEVAGAPTHHILRHTPDSAWAEIGTTDTLGYLDESVGNGGVYSYAVQIEEGGRLGALLPAQGSAVPSAQHGQTPAGLAAVAGDGCVTLTWDLVPGAFQFYPARATAPGGPFLELGGSANGFDNRYTDCGLANDETYVYVLRTWSPTFVYSAFSGEVAAVPQGAAPATPAIVPYDGRSQVVLGWDDTPRATEYTIHRRTDRTPWRAVGRATLSAFSDDGVLDETTYHYSVEGVGPGGRGAGSPVVQGRPSVAHGEAPGAAVATPGAGCVTLTWAPIPGPHGYCIGQADAPGADFLDVLCTASDDPFENLVSVCGLEDDRSYSFVVRQWSAAEGYSAFSVVATATPRADLPGAPALPPVAASAVPGAVSLSWEPVPGAIAYRVLARTENTPWRVVGQSVGPSFTERGLPPGQTRTYAIQAINPAGAGARGPETVVQVP